MSLLEELYEGLTFIDKARVPDGYGGAKTEWRDGATFMGVANLDTSMEARVAQQEGVNNVYTIVAPKEVSMEYGDILRRESDGKLFRVTSDGADKKTPGSASLNMRVVSAEELKGLPNG